MESTDALAVPASLCKVHEDALVSAEHCEYRVLQATLFKKPGSEPTGDRIVRLQGRVGSTVHATGRVWTGPSGGKWIELDSLVEKPGWLLLEGSGFGVPGPLLQIIHPDDDPPVVLNVVKPDKFDGTRRWREIVVHSSSKVSEIKIWISLLFGLEPHLIVLSTPKKLSELDVDKFLGVDTYYIGAESLLTNDTTIGQAGFSDGDEVQYVYMGELEKTGEGKEPAWMGKRKDDPAEKSGRRKLQDLRLRHPELQAHLDLLGIPENAHEDDIKRQYRHLALECHPDKNPEELEAATKRFQDVKAAYEAIRVRLRI